VSDTPIQSLIDNFPWPHLHFAGDASFGVKFALSCAIGAAVGVALYAVYRYVTSD
jgi:hypothetical protein